MRKFLQKIVFTWAEREALKRLMEPDYHCLEVAADFVNHNEIEGDYLEFGCYSGKTFNKAKSLLKGRRHFAFDSFQGLPPPLAKHKYHPSHWDKGSFSITLEEFKKRVGEAIIIDGWYHETLTEELYSKHKMNRVAVVNIDCDLYESSIRCLDFISPLVQDGTVIVFDDYNFFRGRSDAGERKALNEWLKSNPNIKANWLASQGFDKAAFYLEVD